jgi:pimeloyl-ACP methyl ester carboxylesterase
MSVDAPELPKRPLALKLAGYACLLTIAALVAIRVLNHASTFPPLPKDRSLAPRLAGERNDVREVEIATADGVRLYGWVQGRDDAPRKIIQFMGNGEYIGPFTETYAASARALDAQFLLFDYRGFANSEGKPSEPGLYHDAEATWAYATGELGWRPGKIILWGRSLGCGPATWLAKRQINAEAPPAAMILEAGFSSIADMSRAVMGWLIKPDWLIYNLFDNLGRAPSLNLPVFHYHGPADEVIPYEQGVRLHAALPGPKRFLELKGAKHNDIWNDEARASTIRTGIDAFLREQGI